MADNSDYTKPYTKLFELLPEVYKSDANKSLFANLFDRYLTKQETERVAGYIGEGNPNAIVSRQIHENSIHRQAYQLQPILYNKVGSVEWMASWKDILNEAERQGIDDDYIQQWMSLLQFNWAPPIDIDKLIHYQDYYWYDEDSGSSPQYITIRSRCTTANAKVSYQQSLISEYGAQYEIVELHSSENNGEYDTIVIEGNYSRLFETGFTFYVVGSTNVDLNTSFWTSVESNFYDNINKTYVKINTTTTDDTADGFMSLNENLTLLTNEATCICETTACGAKSAIPAADQWIDSNKWLHKVNVPNFSIAKQAAVPIIEYDWDLELNEWTYTSYAWKYRSSVTQAFADVDDVPDYIEYVPIENYWLYDGIQNKIQLDDRYGDLTDYFVPGRTFLISYLSQLFEVEASEYLSLSADEPKKTVITLTEDFIEPSGFVFGGVDDGTPSMYNTDIAAFRPLETSLGDTWTGHHEHWVLTDVQTTLPVVHQPENPLMELTDYYSQTFVAPGTYSLSTTPPVNTSLSMASRSLVGTNNVRVYVDNVRQYGTYTEDADVNGYVSGITFISGYEPTSGDVEIQVGEAAISDAGNSAIFVRTVEDDAQFASDGLSPRTLVSYRKEEQIKTQRNQYPLFDLYNVDGTPAFKAETIFKLATDPNADVNVAIGQRLKTDGELNYIFEQSLIDEDNGSLYAYRDYFNHEDDILVDNATNSVYFWTGTCWSTTTNVGIAVNITMPAAVGDLEPTSPIEGMYWLNTLTGILMVYSGATWTMADALYQADDPTLQTIWKKGLNDEKYSPVKRDEKKRTEEEYRAAEDAFVLPRVEELINTGVSLTDAFAKALDEWTLKETTHLSQFDDAGNIVWAGDWELPDPLYYNNSHENRKEISLIEVVSHFASIIDAQPTIPGYSGTAKAMFHLIPTNEVNYGLGGKIREYQYGFDTFLSALFVNEVSPRSLINFGHDQYEILINNLKEFYRSNVIDLLSDVSDEAMEDLSTFVSDYVINVFEQNDQLAQIYGDSTTFFDNEVFDDIGVRNWIATLPFLCLQEKHVPNKVTDVDRNLNHIVHHDGHREDYFLEDATVEGIRYGLVNAPDPRDPLHKMGVISNSQPPNTVADFESQYGTEINNRDGVYWYHSNGTTRTLYRLTPLSIGVEAPADDTPEGTTWLDLNTGQEALRVRSINEYTGDVEWNVPAGIIAGDSPIQLHDGTGDNDTATISAWTVIDVNELLRDVIFEVETRLYAAAPECKTLKYDYDALRAEYPTRYDQYLEEQYLAFAREREITAPYANTQYDAANAFTWNYKYSTHGTGFQIVDIDTGANAFVIEGDYELNFPPSSSFFIKNNGPNDGTWSVITAVADVAGEFTTINVAGVVEDSIGGVIYNGVLPSTLNDGSESGGDWRDLYEKFYGTPFPHLEPWKLQGYDDKPYWWDDEYANNDPLKWGTRRWKYKHGFALDSANVTTNSFDISGDFREAFIQSQVFTVDGGSPHDGGWTVDVIGPVVDGVPGIAGTCRLELDGDHVSIFQPDIRFLVHDSANNLKQLLTVDTAYFTGPPTNRTVISVKEGIEDLTGYDFFGASTYDVSTNKTTIRVVESITANTTDSGRIARRYGMWDMIMRGLIPENTEYPNGLLGVSGNYFIDFGVSSTIPQYYYLSVNIGNDTINFGGEYKSDEVFPPYWDYEGYFGNIIPPNIDVVIRSLYWQFTVEIISPAADYVFGDSGPYEWLWKESSQYLYDQMVIAFRLDPIRFIHTVFGSDYNSVNGLLIDSRTQRVLTHVDVDFHGDLIDNEVFKVNGINQWYVNYLRYLDYDISMSDFRSMWSKWTAPMMYQFSSFIDTPSLDVGHRQVCVSDFDYRVAAKRSPGVEDYWLDSFNVNIIKAPPKIARQDNEYAWNLSITTKTPFANTIEYYDVQNYQFYADPVTDLCTLFSWNLSNVNFFNNTFTIGGDQTTLFLHDSTMEVVESTDPALNTSYTVDISTYDRITDTTIIQVQEFLPSTLETDGRIILNDRTLPWETGENITLTTHGLFPTPLRTDNVNGVYEYFIIRVSDNTFRLALTPNDATLGSYVDITSPTQNDLFVGKIYTTFTDGVQPVLWRHYALDKTTVRSFVPPYEFSGLQNLINIIDGYEEYTTDMGWRYNIDNTLRDPSNTAFTVNWQHELIRFLEFAYNVRLAKTKVPDNRYPVDVDEATNIWTLTDNGSPQLITGDPISVFSSNQLYPTPLSHGGRYYMIRDSLEEFRIAATKTDAMQGIEIDIISTVGPRDLFITDAKSLNVSSSLFEINPFRNAIWFRPERGIVSNLLEGPTDSFSSHVLVDQYGRAITQDAIRVYREDKETKISIADGLANDVELTRVYQDPYNLIHLGAAHLFVDTYEHVLIFNGETTADQLLYDSFLGLNLTKFEMLFNRQTEFTQRPNVGGQYLRTFYNQGADLDRNIEASVEDLRYLYDTYRVIEANELITQGRKSIGYVKEGTYFDNMNLNDKSQFIFWRGQIQHKGAMTSIQAFINSRRFIDASVDEYWAVKVGEFGSDLEKEYVEMWLTTDDVANDDIFLLFQSGDVVACNAGYDTNAYDIGCGFDYPSSGESVVISDSDWTNVNVVDQSRWYNYPNQQAELKNNAGSMYFDLAAVNNMPITIGNMPPANPSHNDGWVDNSLAPILFSRWNAEKGYWDVHGNWDSGSSPIIRHGMKSDLTTVTATVKPSSWASSPLDTGFYDADGATVAAGDGHAVSIPEYVIETGMIKVFMGTGSGDAFVGTELVKGVDYAEEVQNNFLSDKIYITNAVTAADTIRVVYGSATFTQDIHYQLFNTDIIKFLFAEMASSIVFDLKLWGWNFDKNALNPHSIIDVKSDTMVTRIQVWDPARGWHYYNADHIIDMKLNVDPAFYSESLVSDDKQLEVLSQPTVRLSDSPKTAEKYWGSARVGTTLLNTEHLDYIPYYDPAVIPKLDDRLLVWGRLADWSAFKIYTWVESDVPPEEWNDLAVDEESDATIPQKLRKSGRTFQTTFKDNGGDWVLAENVHESFDPIINATTFLETATTYEFVTAMLDATSSTVRLFVNGQIHPDTEWIATSANTFEVSSITQNSKIEMIDFVPGQDPTLDDETNASNLEAAIETGDYSQGYQYTVENYIDYLDQERFRYYFWVEDKTTKGERIMSPQNAQTTMENFPIPYIVYQDVQPGGDVLYNDTPYYLPPRFQRSVLRGLRTVVDDNDRYIIRWIRDFTLRDSLLSNSLAKKDIHESWDLIRREMPYQIPRWLWDKLTESMIGYLLTDPTVRVPTYERELYDLQYGSDTQYGIGTGQSFTDGTLALETIVRYLNDPDNDFSPININVFFTQNNFESAAAIVDAMDNIYNNFPYLHVNEMFFDTLLDAFSKKTKYEGIFKTSMIAVHGIRPIEISGVFDD